MGAADLRYLPGHRRDIAHAADGVDPGRRTATGGRAGRGQVGRIALRQPRAPPRRARAQRRPRHRGAGRRRSRDGLEFRHRLWGRGHEFSRRAVDDRRARRRGGPTSRCSVDDARPPDGGRESRRTCRCGCGCAVDTPRRPSGAQCQRSRGLAAMIPTWVAVVTGISLAILALAAIVIAAASVVAALGFRAFLRVVRALVAAIRSEADGLVGTSRDLRERIVKAADAAEARLADLDAVFEVVREEVETTVLDVAATMRTVRRGISLLEWGRRTLKRGKKR